eukprot:31289_3
MSSEHPALLEPLRPLTSSFQKSSLMSIKRVIPNSVPVFTEILRKKETVIIKSWCGFTLITSNYPSFPKQSSKCEEPLRDGNLTHPHRLKSSYTILDKTENLV